MPDEQETKRPIFGFAVRPLVCIAIGILVLSLTIAGWVAGFETIRPTCSAAIDAVIGTLSFGLALAVAIIAGGMGYAVSHLSHGWQLSWFCRSKVRTWIWVASVIAVAVSLQCLVPPWECEIGDKGGTKYSGHYPIWSNPPNALVWMDDGSSYRSVVPRISGALLATQLFFSGFLLAFYARSHIRFNSPPDQTLDEAKDLIRQFSAQEIIDGMKAEIAERREATKITTVQKPQNLKANQEEGE